VITRRQFVQQLSMMAGGLLAGASVQAGMRVEDPSSPFIFTQVEYRGGDWDPHPSGPSELLKEVDRRTSIAVSFQRHTVTLADPDLFSYPFLYLTGALDFAPFGEAELVRLRRFLTLGGFMLVNDASGYRGNPFERRLREEVQRLFGDQPL
jgi:hypothetical protein